MKVNTKAKEAIGGIFPKILLNPFIRKEKEQDLKNSALFLSFLKTGRKIGGKKVFCFPKY